MADLRIDLAQDILERAHQLQLQGEIDLAAEMYRQSIEAWPTPEAYTYLGWTYHHQGRIEDAIAECKKAIDLDPDFGNPYNDIGAYLIELGQPEEAFPWLEKAIVSARYDAYHFPWYNLGRVYLAREMFNRARECFERSLEIQPDYQLAIDALARITRLVQ
jgi:Tfp pilus assembly protein PilF